MFASIRQELAQAAEKNCLILSCPSACPKEEDILGLSLWDHERRGWSGRPYRQSARMDRMMAEREQERQAAVRFMDAYEVMSTSATWML